MKDPLFERLSTDFQRERIIAWLEEYVSTLSHWTGTIVAPTLDPQARAQASAKGIFGPNFDIDKELKDELAERNRRTLLWVLVYHLQKVSTTDLFKKIRDYLYSIDPQLDHASLGDSVKWSSITAFILTLAADGDTVSDLITYACCLHRGAGSHLHDWLRSIVATKSRLAKVKVEFPPSVWSTRAWTCMTNYERALLVKDKSPAENLKTLSKHYSRSSLRPYPAAEASKTRPLIPYLGYRPAKSHLKNSKEEPNRKGGRRENSRNDNNKYNNKKKTSTDGRSSDPCTWCGLKGHAEAACRKKESGLSKSEAKAAVKENQEWKKRSNSNTDSASRKAKCHICGSTNHLRAKCPKKKADQGFAVETEQREATEPESLRDEEYWCMEECLMQEGARLDCLRARIQVYPRAGDSRSVTAAVDSFSSRTFCLKSLAITYQDLPPKLKQRYSWTLKSKETAVRTCGNTIKFKDHGFICIQKLSKKLVLPVIITTSEYLPLGCGALLGMDAIVKHEIDLSAMVFSRGHIPPDIQWRTEAEVSSIEEASKDTGAPAQIQNLHAGFPRNLDDYGDEEVWISEVDMASYLRRQPDGDFKDHAYSVDDILVNPDLPESTLVEVRRLLHQYSKVFHKSKGLPPPMKAEPMRIILREGFQRQRCATPRWTPAKRRFLTLFGQNGLASGRLEASNGTWSSRIHTVKKKSKTNNQKDWTPRVCGDYVRVNEQTVKETTPVVRVDDNVRKHDENSLFIVTDMASGYEQCELAKPSRHIAALLTPIGVLQPKRVTFGLVNAATHLQKSLLPMINSLPDFLQRVLGWQVDDFIIAPPHTELIRFLKIFLDGCEKHGVSLSIPKTKIGFPWAKAVGHCLSQGRFWIHDDNLAPIRKFSGHFRELSELRSFLGSLIFCKDHIRDFAVISKPLHNQTRKGRFDASVFREPKHPPIARSQEREAFLRVKAAALDQYPLYCPVYEWPFHLDVDASDQGIGWCLYQVHPKDVLPDEEWHRLPPSKKRVLRLGSKGFSPFLSKMPIYYKEAWGLVVGLHANRHFFFFSSLEVVVHSDHQPLRWIKHSPKGVVSSWLLVFLADVRFRVVYLLGVKNVIADPMSRPPLVSPNLLSAVGLDRAVMRLIRLVPEIVSDKLWLYSYREPDTVARLIRETRKSVSPAIVVAAPKSAPNSLAAIIIPKPSLAPVVTAELFLSSRSFAVLIPMDLVPFVPSVSKSRSAHLKECITEARKIVFLDSGFVWVIRGFPGVHEVFPAEQTSAVGASPLDSWIEEQREYADEFAQHFSKSIAKRSSGLLVAIEDGKPTRVLVPPSQREPLTIQTHERLNHAGPRRTFNRICERYLWYNMYKDITDFLLACQACSLIHSKVIASHRLYNPFSASLPFRCYAMDWVVMPKAKDGSTQIFVAIDLASRRAIFEPQPDRSARSACTAILKRIVYPRGSIAAMWSDSDQSFLSRLQSLLFRSLGTKHTVTNRYPKGNSMVERVMPFLGDFFRLLPPSLRPLWPQQLPKLEFAAASVSNETTGVSPFKFESGLDPLMPFDAATVEVPADPTELLSGKLSVGAFSAIGKQISAFRELAVQRAGAVTNARAERLNGSGHRLPPISVADPVVVYMPAKGEPGWRPKHCLQWKAAFVIEKESNAWYSTQEQGTSRIFRRHRSLISIDHSRQPLTFRSSDALKRSIRRLPRISCPTLSSPAMKADVSAEPDSVEDSLVRPAFHSRYTAGSARLDDMLLVRDDDVSTLIFPVRVTGFADDGVVVHYWGTTDASPDATFRPCWIERGKTAIGEKARSRSVHSPKWSGVVPDDPDLILMKVKMSPGSPIPKRARAYLVSIGFDHATL